MSDCVICLKLLAAAPVERPSCGHAFHRDCLAQWTARNASCPTCRAPVAAPPTPATVSRELDGRLRAHDLGAAEARRELAQTRARQMGALEQRHRSERLLLETSLKLAEARAGVKAAREALGIFKNATRTGAKVGLDFRPHRERAEAKLLRESANLRALQTSKQELAHAKRMKML